MDFKRLAMGAVVAALGATLFIGCAKPPTEKVDALTAQFTQLQEKGGQVFAQAEYDAVNAQMSALQGLMDQKKYKDAAALCDSIETGMTALSAAIDANGQQIAQQEVTAATEGLVTFKALVEANKKALGTDNLQKYTDQITALDTQAAGLQAELDAQNFLNAYTVAKTATDQLTAATTEINTVVEEAKAAKGGKK